MDTWVGFEPNDEQLRVLQLVYATFEASGEWPFLQYLRLQATKAGIANLDECLRLLPRSYLYPRALPSNPSDEVRLSVPALANLDAARGDLDLFVLVLQIFGSEIARFEPSPREVRLIEVSTSKLRAKSPGISDLQLRKVFSLLQAEPLGSTKGHGPEGPIDWYVSMDPEEAGRLGQVTSVEEYLGVRHLFPDELTPSGRAASSLQESESEADSGTTRGRRIPASKLESRLDAGVIAALVAVAVGAAVLDRRGFLRAVVMLAVIFCVVAAIRMRRAKWRSAALCGVAAVFGIWFLALLPSGSSREQPPEHIQLPSPTSRNGPSPSTTETSSPTNTTPTSAASPARIEQITVEQGESAYVLDGAVRISVIGIDFSGSPLRHRVDAIVTEVVSGASLTMTLADVGFDQTFGDRRTYRVTLLSADTFDAQFEVRLVDGADE